MLFLSCQCTFSVTDPRSRAVTPSFCVLASPSAKSIHSRARGNAQIQYTWKTNDCSGTNPATDLSKIEINNYLTNPEECRGWTECSFGTTSTCYKGDAPLQQLPKGMYATVANYFSDSDGCEGPFSRMVLNVASTSADSPPKCTPTGVDAPYYVRTLPLMTISSQMIIAI